MDKDSPSKNQHTPKCQNRGILRNHCPTHGPHRKPAVAAVAVAAQRRMHAPALQIAPSTSSYFRFVCYYVVCKLA